MKARLDRLEKEIKKREDVRQNEKFTRHEIASLLQNEIDWCLDNPDKELSKDQQMGFVNGLKQAQLLIQRAEHKHTVVSLHS